MNREVHAALRASLKLEQKLMKIAEDKRLAPQERGARIRALLAESPADSLVNVWAKAGRPAPLGFVFNAKADHAEWFDAWVEVESLVLDGEDHGYSRAEQQQMILNNEAPFDQEFEAEDLGIIYRSNERQHTD